ncbi:hypothetical protein VNO78_32886 [Psophocarpus tetragonolobus]|uniref:HMA domain-containing protein n=1 Tax=Psophocarpus tetragonolobus TaxID=3891 RepID=A0AAN9RPB5_PSOTE
MKDDKCTASGVSRKKKQNFTVVDEVEEEYFVVLQLDLNKDKIKRKAMKTASDFQGVESVSVDMNDKKMTILGNIDPVSAVWKLRKLCHTEIVSVGPAKEEEKKEELGPEKVPAPIKVYDSYYPVYYPRIVPQNYYYEENPRGCVMC